MRRAARSIINLEWLILLLLLPLLLFPSGWRGLLLLIIPFLWLIRKLANGYFVPPTAYDTSVLLMMTAVLISLSAVFDIELSFPKIAGIILGVAYFYGGVQYTREYGDGKYHLLGLILVAGTAMGTVGLMSILQSPIIDFMSGFTAGYLALIPTYLSNLVDVVNPNELAGVLGWVLPLLFACSFGFWRGMWRSRRSSLRLLLLVLGVMLIFCSLLLVATRSRGGLISVIIALLVMLAIRYHWGRWLLLVITLGIIALGFNLNLGTILFGDVPTAAVSGLQGRLEIWSRALFGLADFPFTGMSMNGFRQVVHILYPLFSLPPGFDLGHAHNHLLQAGLDLGIIGLIAYLSIWVLSAALLWIGWRRTHKHNDRVLIIGISGSMTAGWLFGILDAIALGARPGFLWWLLLALLVTVCDNVMANREDKTREWE